MFSFLVQLCLGLVIFLAFVHGHNRRALASAVVLLFYIHLVLHEVYVTCWSFIYHETFLLYSKCLNCVTLTLLQYLFNWQKWTNKQIKTKTSCFIKKLFLPLYCVEICVVTNLFLLTVPMNSSNIEKEQLHNNGLLKIQAV